MSRILIEEVKRASAELGTNAAARTAIDAVVSAIDRVTQRGERVTIQGFGTFERKIRAARKARNPRTGEPIHVAERRQLAFKPTAKD